MMVAIKPVSHVDQSTKFDLERNRHCDTYRPSESF
jgi:hypothetical protein